MQLTEHFSLSELTHSSRAEERGLDNVPTPEDVSNLTLLAQTLERVRAILGHPIKINSGYRSPEVNVAVGGSKFSAHCHGWAADFTCPGAGTPEVVARKIDASGIDFDQLIYENSWVHLSVDPRARREALTAHFDGGRATYTSGIA